MLDSLLHDLRGLGSRAPPLSELTQSLSQCPYLANCACAQSDIERRNINHLLALFGPRCPSPVAGWGAHGSRQMQMQALLNEVVLFSCVGALFMGIVLTAASFIG